MSNILEQASMQLMTNVIKPLFFKPTIEWLKVNKGVDITIEELMEITKIPPSLPTSVSGSMTSTASSGSIKSISHATAMMPPKCANIKNKGKKNQENCENPALVNCPFCKACKKTVEAKSRKAENPKESVVEDHDDHDHEHDHHDDEPTQADPSRFIVVDLAKNIYRDPVTNFAVTYTPDEQPSVFGMFEGKKSRKLTKEEKERAKFNGFLIDETVKTSSKKSDAPAAPMASEKKSKPSTDDTIELEMSDLPAAPAKKRKSSAKAGAKVVHPSAPVSKPKAVPVEDDDEEVDEDEVVQPPKTKIAPPAPPKTAKQKVALDEELDPVSKKPKSLPTAKPKAHSQADDDVEDEDDNMATPTPHTKFNLRYDDDAEEDVEEVDTDIDDDVEDEEHLAPPRQKVSVEKAPQSKVVASLPSVRPVPTLPKKSNMSSSKSSAH